MATRLVLHLGTMKSGTTFVQNALSTNKELLADRGVLFPGSGWGAQVRAVQELTKFGGASQQPRPAKGAWQRLRDEIHAWSGTAIVSMEFLAPRREEKIAQILAEFPDTRVEAILTCRDLARQIPAMWQEGVQNGGITAWADYLDAVRRRRKGDRIAHGFWKHQDVPQIADRWSAGLGADNFSLVTLPPPGSEPNLLWQRFTEAADIDGAGFDLKVRSNSSIGVATAQMLLRLNQTYHREAGGLPEHYFRYLKQGVIKAGLVNRAKDEPRLGLRKRWVTKRGDAQIRSLEQAGHRVVGDLQDLHPRGVDGIHADRIGESDVLDAALAGLARALEGWAEEADKPRRGR